MSMLSKSAILAAATLFLLGPATSAFAASEADCEAMFVKADTDGDGSLAKMEDKKWEERINHMTSIKRKDQDIIHKSEFMESCKMGEMDGM